MKKGGLGSRLIVAGWGIPLLLWMTYMGGWWTAILIVVLAMGAQEEYYRMQVVSGHRPLRIIGLICGIMIVLAWSTGINYLGWVVALSVVMIMIGGLFSKRVHADLITTIWGVLYPPLLMGAFLFIRGWGSTNSLLNDGQWLAFCVFGAIWTCDTAAYFGGKAFGKHKLAPNVSPNKTIEGFVFGFFGAVLLGLAFWWIGLVSLEMGLVIGTVAGTFGQVGDLVESSMKREAGVKDSGGLLPGHGGLLDRFDSLLTTAPVVAIYLLIR